MSGEPVFAVVLRRSGSYRYAAPDATTYDARSSHDCEPGDIVQVLEAGSQLPFVRFSDEPNGIGLVYLRDIEVLP